MKLEIYYNNLTIRLFALITLSFILSGFYLKYIKQSDTNSFLKQAKAIYSMQIVFWVLFLSNFLDKILPNNVFGSFTFELITLIIIFLTYTFLLWELLKRQKFDLGLFFFSLPLMILFIFSLGATRFY